MPRPIRPEAAEALAQYRADLAAWVEGHAAESLTASAGMLDQALADQVAALGALRKELVTELRADGAAAEGFDQLLASIEKLKSAEEAAKAAILNRIEASSKLDDLDGDTTTVVVPDTGKKITVKTGDVAGVSQHVEADGAEKTFVTEDAAEKLAAARDGLAAGAGLTDTPQVEATDTALDGDADLPTARVTASIGYHTPEGKAVAFGSEIASDEIVHAMIASLRTAEGLAAGGRQVAVTINQYAHMDQADMLQLAAGSSAANGALIERYRDQHRATRELRASLNANPTASRYSQVTQPTSLTAAAKLCVPGKVNYDIKQCATLGRPFTDCVFVNVPSERGSLTNYFGRNFDRAATPQGITEDCPDGTPSNKVCFTITDCATPQTATICAHAVCIKVGVFSKINHPEQLRNEIHLVNVANDVAQETKALNWVRNQSLIMTASPFYGSDNTIYANVVRAVIGIISNLRMNGFKFDMAMAWWLPYHLLINDSAAGSDRGRSWNSVADVTGWLKDAIPGLGNICTYIDTATANGAPSQVWDPTVAGPIQPFPAVPEIMIIPEGYAGKLTAPGIDMGSSLEDAKMFSDADRTGNCLSMFREEFYGFAKMHDCGKLLTIQFPGLCADGTYAPAAAAALCGNDV